MPARNRKSEIEIELKISLSRKDMEKVFRALSQKGGATEVLHKYIPRAYYDTPDLRLYRNGLSLRVQYKPGKSGRLGGYEQTVKLEVPQRSSLGEAVLSRMECQDSLRTHEPSFAAVTDPRAKAALKPFKTKKFMHIFTAQIERRFFEMKLRDGTVEIAFDAGKIILAGGNAHQDFSEVEVEIKRGEPELIDIVKREILRLAPSAKVQPLSKAAQGSRLYLKHQKILAN